MARSIGLLKAQPLDLMQVHNLLDQRLHLATLRDWKQAGRVRYIGVTHYHDGAHADLAAEIGCATWSELALKYLLGHEAVTCVIPATRQPQHMAANARAGTGVLPDDTTRALILKAAGL